MTDRKQRVAAYAVCVRDEQLLLARFVGKDGSTEWTLPGGGIEHGEDPPDAAVREVYEETGYKVELDELLGIDSIVLHFDRRRRKPTNWHGIRIVYTGRVVGGELRDEVNGSTDMARWIPLAEVAGLPRVSLVDIGLRLHRDRPASGRL